MGAAAPHFIRESENTGIRHLIPNGSGAFCWTFKEECREVPHRRLKEWPERIAVLKRMPIERRPVSHRRWQASAAFSQNVNYCPHKPSKLFYNRNEILENREGRGFACFLVIVVGSAAGICICPPFMPVWIVAMACAVIWMKQVPCAPSMTTARFYVM